MAIQGPKPQGPSKILTAGLGFITGGGLGAGGMSAGLQGAGMSLAGASGGSIAPLSKMYSAIDGALSKKGPVEPDTAGIQVPEIGSAFSDAGKYDAVGNKLNLMGQDPMELTHQGLALLQDPSIPQELRDQYAPQLLAHKIYGYKAGGR